MLQQLTIKLFNGGMNINLGLAKTYEVLTTDGGEVPNNFKRSSEIGNDTFHFSRVGTVEIEAAFAEVIKNSLQLP